MTSQYNTIQKINKSFEKCFLRESVSNCNKYKPLVCITCDCFIKPEDLFIINYEELLGYTKFLCKPFSLTKLEQLKKDYTAVQNDLIPCNIQEQLNGFFCPQGHHTKQI
jgi:hypothetical protein